MCKSSRDYKKTFLKKKKSGHKTSKDNKTPKLEARNSCNQNVSPKNEPLELVEKETKGIVSCFKEIK